MATQSAKSTAKLVQWSSKDGTKSGYSYVPGSDVIVDAMIEDSAKMAEALKRNNQTIADRIGQAADLPNGTLGIAFTRWADCNVFEKKDKSTKAKATRQTTNVGEAFKSKAA